MSTSSYTPRENLTLTDAGLAAGRPIAGVGGRVLRALSPFHGSDHQRGLRVTLATGRFQSRRVPGGAARQPRRGMDAAAAWSFPIPRRTGAW